MISKLLREANGQRTFALILETGNDPMSCLTEFAREEGVTGASITGIGAFSEARLAYFDWDTKEYQEIPVREQVEVASLIGDIGLEKEGNPAVHVHLVVGRRDGSAVAGHLLDARVRPTLELIVTEAPPHLCRHKDPESGLNLIRF